MPPATRREVRLSASLPDPAALNSGSGSGDGTAAAARSAGHLLPNVEQILDNFEQFKRKHISQNREIIKTNALAQIRIRELETRIQTLETERAQQALASIELKAQVSRLDYALTCVKIGWETIGRGLAGAPGPSSGEMQSFDGLGLHMDIMTPEPHLRSGSRITLDPSALPAGVARPVARAPEGHMINLMEEDEDVSFSNATLDHHHVANDVQGQDQDSWHQQRQDTPMLLGSQGFEAASDPSTNDSHGPSLLRNRRSSSTYDADGPPSPMSSPGLPMDIEDALATASREGFTGEWHPTPQVDVEALKRASKENGQKLLRRSSRRSSRRQSGLLSPPMLDEEEQSGDEHNLAGPSSYSGLSHSNGTRENIHQMDEDEAEEGEGEDEDADDGAHPAVNGHNGLPTPPSPFDMHTASGATISPELMSASAILREVTNGVKNGTKFRQAEEETEIDFQAESTKPVARRSRRSKMGPELMAKKASIEDFGTLEAVTPSALKRKVPVHELDEVPTPSTTPAVRPPSPSATPSVGRSQPPPASTTPADTDTFGRARRTRKSINYALPKLNTKMRKPDPVDLVPASTTTLAGSTPRTSTPSSARSGRVGSAGNLSDIRRLHEANSASKASGNGSTSHSAQESDRYPKRSDGPDDEDGNGEGGSASLADLFETNPRRPRAATSKSRVSDASDDTAEDGEIASSSWRPESVTDTSDDESRIMSPSDLSEIAELEGAMDDLSTSDKPISKGVVRVNTRVRASMGGETAAQQITKSGSSGSIHSSSSSVDGDGTTRRPSLRRRSTTVINRQPSASAIASSGTTGMPRSSSSESISGNSRRSGSDDQPGDTGTAPDEDATVTLSGGTEGTPTQASESAKTQRGVPARRVSATPRLAANMKPKERPLSSGSTGSTSARSVSSTSSTVASPKLGVSNLGGQSGSLGRSGQQTPSLQRGSLHAALTNQPRSVSGPSQGGSPLLRASPLLGPGKSLRPSASTSSLTTSSSGRSSPALSIASTASSSASHVSVAGRTVGPSSLSKTAIKSGVVSSRTNGPEPHPVRSMPSLKRIVSAESKLVGTKSNGSAAAGNGSGSTVSSSSSTSSSGAPRITVRSSTSASSLSSDKSTASSNATVTPAGISS